MSNPLLAALLLAFGRGSASGQKKQVGRLAFALLTALWQLGVFFADVELDKGHTKRFENNATADNHGAKYHVYLKGCQDNRLSFGYMNNNYYH